MADESSNLQVNITAEDDLSAVLESLQETLDELSTSIDTLSDTMEGLSEFLTAVGAQFDVVSGAVDEAGAALGATNVEAEDLTGSLLSMNAALIDVVASSGEADAGLGETAETMSLLEGLGNQAEAMFERLTLRLGILGVILGTIAYFKAAIDDATKSNADFAKGVGDSDAVLQTFQVLLGDAILPAIVQVKEVLADMAGPLEKNKGDFDSLGQTIFTVTQVVETLAAAFGFVVAEMNDVVKFVETVLGDVFAKWGQDTGDKIRGLIDLSKGDLTDAFTAFTEKTTYNFDNLGASVDNFGTDANNFGSEFTDIWSKTYTPVENLNDQLQSTASTGVKGLQDAVSTAVSSINSDLQSVADKIASTNASLDTLTQNHVQTQQTAQNSIAQAFIDAQKNITDLQQKVNEESMTALTDSNKQSTDVRNAYDIQANAILLNDNKEKLAEAQADYAAHANVLATVSTQVTELQKTNNSSALDQAIATNSQKEQDDDAAYQAKSTELQKELTDEQNQQTQLVKIHNELKDQFAAINAAEESNNKDTLARMLAEVQNFAAQAKAALASITGGALTVGATPAVPPLSTPNVSGSSVATASAGSFGPSPAPGTSGTPNFNVTVNGNISSHEDALNVGQAIAQAIAPHLAYQGGTAYVG